MGFTPTTPGAPSVVWHRKRSDDSGFVHTRISVECGDIVPGGCDPGKRPTYFAGYGLTAEHASQRGDRAAIEPGPNPSRKHPGPLECGRDQCGGVDGQWGRKTRAGITQWQSNNGLVPSGFLNPAQYDLLVSQTEGRYTPYVAPKAVARKSTSGGKRKATTKRRNNNDALGAAILGVAIGTILSK
ncbi:peptidoglycan-binding protein [Tateyamaria omphalii]|uniref:peptidoglycan-binding protein n=1 Tax=Tateyamaria omphalii TaxID=299262 RepID=UPI0034A0CA17